MSRVSSASCQLNLIDRICFLFGRFCRSARPILIERPSSQTVTEDEAVEFACSTDGFPSPFITWLKDGTPLVPDARTAIGQTRVRIEQVKVRLSEFRHLLLESTGFRSGGFLEIQYVCYASKQIQLIATQK